MPKYLTIVLSLFVTGLFLTVEAALAQEPLRIGFGGALQGNLSAYGRSTLFGAEYAVNQVNSKGGLLGRQVELVIQDDACDPALATTAANKLRSSGLSVILGHTCSTSTRSALSVYANAVILVSAASTETSLTFDGQNPYFFRTTPYDSAQSKLQVDLLMRLGVKSVAILHDKTEYGKALVDYTISYLRDLPGKPIQVVLEQGVTVNQTDYDPVANAIKDSGAEAVIWGGYYPDGSKLAISLKNMGANALLIGADGLYDQQFLSLAGQAAEDTFVTGQTDYSTTEEARAAIADHRSRHKDDIGAYFFYSIAAAQTLFHAIEATGSTTDLNTIKKHLTEDTVDTIIGPVRYDQRGDVIGGIFKVYRVVNGQFEEYPLTIPEPAAAQN
ncbi:MAG: branched-chain amino acid ABC transporter substrate-binding protein [Deltaproteobacteria bacterium]|jgi:branched-chain amino acid transport system substrate-binding protein|nr:branched-chain amino acid ABC transporter substrate-binding protein [Deltaproteobacteria bacterium]